ncbi:mitochondrial carrier [Dichomitus squalens LYAD-421 SS1]|uniref:Mitochondrial carrier n=2 Tax=Dichomitus squalens TaxID=114155 RepID=A0A4Q9QEG9_9APHY|nr:mitochondrial carrier [Dichomitus squalens LYAD-421 SS1]EJF58568.1 mitochondrial carrier [Dichomitus squalens LYAD-421 SS1]TBU25062.1 mitochondrial carrier [Dichomitus squalens]TBU65184.1 mitochondrial carrier [Dichomitus squalens]
MSSDASPKDRQSLSYVLRSGLAGGVAGCVAKTVVAPLDRVKILFQASNPDFQKYAGTWSGAFRAVSQIYRENGMRGLLQGHSATLLRIAPYAAIKFMTYDQVEALLMPTRESQTNLRRFTAGAISGITSVFFTYPLELIRVRMAFETHKFPGPSQQRPSFLSAMRRIYHEAPQPAPSAAASASSAVIATDQVKTSLFTRFPVLKFYRGFTVTTIGMIPYAGTSFLFWGFLRAHFFPYREGGSKIGGGPLADLSIGAASGVLAQTVSYPFEVIRRRMQVGGLTQPDRWMRWGETVRTIWVSKGLKGFYVGLTIGYLKVIPMTAISYAVWQWERRMLHL